MQNNSVVCDGVSYSDPEMRGEHQNTFAFAANY